MAISRVVLPEPLGPVTASRAPGSSATGITGGRVRILLSGSVRSRSRRAAIRDRVSCTAAAGRAVVASNADSGNSISIATVIGATASAMPIAATTAPSTLMPTAAVGAAAARAAGAAARSVAWPHSRCLRSASAMTASRRPLTRNSGACSSASITATSRPE